MKLVFTYFLASLLICFSTSYAIEGQWVSDKYTNVAMTVTGYTTNLDGTNVYQLSVNTCPLVYKIQIDQSYITILNLDQQKGTNNCSLVNSLKLAQEIEEKIFYFYINYNKLGFVSVFANKTNVFTRFSKNSTNDYLNGHYKDVVTGQAVIFINNTVYLCNNNLEAGFFTDNVNQFQLNISSVINNQCQSKNKNAQKVFQVLGRATHFRVQMQNILTFYNQAKPTLRLKFVQKHTQLTKNNNQSKNNATNSNQNNLVNGNSTSSSNPNKILDAKDQSKNTIDVSNNKNPSASTVSNSSTQNTQKTKADQKSQDSISTQTKQNILSNTSTTSNTSNTSTKSESNASSTYSTFLQSGNSNSSTASSNVVTQNKNLSTPFSNLTTQIPKNPQNSIPTINSNTSSSTLSSNNLNYTASSSTGIIKNQTSSINQSISSVPLGREPYNGIEIKNENSIGIWNVEYFKNSQVENWPWKIRMNGTYLLLQGCNNISIPTKLNSTTQRFIASPNGIISTKNACPGINKTSIDTVTKANRFEPVRNSTSMMLNFYRNDDLLWSMSRNFNQGQELTIKNRARTSNGEIIINNQANENQKTNSQPDINTISNSISILSIPSAQTSPTSNNNIPKSSQSKNSQPASTINNPTFNSNSPQSSSSSILIGKYNLNSLYQQNLQGTSGQKYIYNFNENIVSLVGTCNSYKYLYTLQQQGDNSVFSVDQQSKIQQKPNGSQCDPSEDALYLRILSEGKTVKQLTNNTVISLKIINSAGEVIALLQKLFPK